MTIREFIEFSEKIFLDKRFQRKAKWEPYMKLAHIVSVYNGEACMDITLVSVRSGLEMALRLGKVKDVEYFTNLLNDGKEYVSIDGNHRTINIKSYSNSEFNVNHNSEDVERNNFLNKTIWVCYLDNVCVDDMPRLFRQLNDGRDTTEHEYRQTYFSEVADYVRRISESKKIKQLTSRLKRVDSDILEDHDFIAQTLYYETHRGKGQYDKKDVTRMYIGDEKDGISRHERNIKILADLVSLIPIGRTNKNLDKSMVFNLYMKISRLSSLNIKIDKNKYKDFVSKFTNLEMDRRNLKTSLGSRTYVIKQSIKNWRDLNGGMTKNLKLRLDVMFTDFGDMSEFVIELDKKRAFDFQDRITIFKRDGYAVVNGEINGEWYKSPDEPLIKKLDFLDIFDTNKWEVDHEVLPHSLGGRTEIDNGRITCSKYNNWKKAKVQKVVN